MKYWAVLGVALLLSGCATLSEEECLSGDWRGIGLRDGTAGQVADAQFARHVKACEKAGITPQRAAWQQGYTEGLRSYCTPAKGLEEGRAGRSYSNVCPVGSEAGFLRGYRVGEADYDARQEVRRVESEMSRLEARNAQIRAALAVKGDPSLRQELRSNESELLRLQLELGFARAEAARTRRAVAEFRAG
ncbi:DUF2799 domain-containing protein [Roseibaca sp. Y0-43]|uniref:DUF2799 domain-containing protein n=1 Tax=Roseibaca sp. Y0-43 TaxID=2816854 RepID=UPI001D0C2CB4|nr:DUF2799 domain-containing protein [Roseibaca sp. Y0-43]MCC1481973.1 DUF2799 domain-containing protein [Roseibaca sp. Y0-43]